MKNKIVLTIGIWDFEDITHQEISDALGLTPIKIFVKGEKTNPKFQVLAKKNGWMYSQVDREYEPFKDQLDSLIELIKSRQTIWKKFARNYYCELSCAIFKDDAEESMPWVHLTREHIGFLNEFRIEFDLDLYA